MNAVPDPAEQISVVASGHPHPPDESALAPAVGLHTFRDFIELGSILQELWAKR